MVETEVSGAVETWLAQSAASLSLFGVGIVIIYYLLDVRMRKQILAIKYIFFLSISDFLLSVGYLLQNHCQLQARFLQFFSVSSFFWSAIFSHYLFVKRGTLADPDYIDKQQSVDPLTKPSRRDILYHLIAWGVPLIFTLVLHSQDAYGPAGTWCWITEEHESKRMLFFYMPLLLVCLWNSVMLFLFYRAVSANANSESVRTVRVQRNLALYVIATLIVWCFGLARRLNEMVTGNDPAVLACFQSFVTPLHGFVNTLVYTFSLKAFQRVIRQRIRGQNAVAMSHGAIQAPHETREQTSASTASDLSAGTDQEFVDDDENDQDGDSLVSVEPVDREKLEAFSPLSPDDARRKHKGEGLTEPLLASESTALVDPKDEAVAKPGTGCAGWLRGLSMQSVWSGVAFASLCLFRGILPLAQKKAGDEFSPMMGNALRSSFGGLMYIATLLSIRLALRLNQGIPQKSRESWEKQVDWGLYPGLFLKIFLIAVFQSQGPVLLISYSVRFIPSGLSAALISTTPLFTLLITKILHSLKPGLIPVKTNESKAGWHRYAVLIGVMIGLAGAALVCIPQMIVQARRSAADLSMAGVGILMSTAAAISIAGAGIYMANFVKDPSAMVKACYAALCGGTLLLVLSCATEVWRLDPFGHGIQSWAWVLLLAATSSYSSNFLNFYLLDTVGALYTSFVWYIVPVVGIFIGALFESEWSDYGPTLIALQCLGCVVIWVGLALTTAPQFAKKK